MPSVNAGAGAALQHKKIGFESGACFITAWDETGQVMIRCAFGKTDCRDDEALDAFVDRHGGLDAAIDYLKACHRQD